MAAPTWMALDTHDRQLGDLAERIDIINTLRHLDEREVTIIRLKFYSGLSQSEIARRLGISQMHVSRLQRNALRTLKQNLGGLVSEDYRT